MRRKTPGRSLTESSYVGSFEHFGHWNHDAQTRPVDVRDNISAIDVKIMVRHALYMFSCVYVLFFHCFDLQKHKRHRASIVSTKRYSEIAMKMPIVLIVAREIECLLLYQMHYRHIASKKLVIASYCYYKTPVQHLET